MGILKSLEDERVQKLRSLKYSSFGVQPPYVSKKIPGPHERSPHVSELSARVDDTVRMTKAMAGKPGRKFLEHQQLLKQSALTGAVVDRLKKGAMDTVKLVGSILAQVAVNGTGTHFILGFDRNSYLGENGANRALAGKPIIPDIDGANQRTLVESKLLGETSKFATSDPSNYLGKEGEQSAKHGQTVIPNNTSDLYSAPVTSSIANDLVGISNQNYYLGKTARLQAKEGTPIFLDSTPTQVRRSTKKSSLLDPTQKYADETALGPSLPGDKSTLAFDKEKSRNESYASKTRPVNIQNRLSLGDQGAKKIPGVSQADKMNRLKEILAPDPETARILKKGIEDIIPFEFDVYSPDIDYFLYFRAFLDSWSDKYSGDWSATNYIGRAEDFYTYQGFKRTVNFSFKIAAFTGEELIPLYRKLNMLAGSTAPTYDGTGQFMRGTMCAITIGDLLVRQDGIITDVSVDWDTSYSWELGIDENGNSNGLPKVPHILKATVTFTPIHNFNVKTDIDFTTEAYLAKGKLNA